MKVVEEKIRINAYIPKKLYEFMEEYQEELTLSKSQTVIMGLKLLKDQQNMINSFNKSKVEK